MREKSQMGINFFLFQFNLIISRYTHRIILQFTMFAINWNNGVLVMRMENEEIWLFLQLPKRFFF